MLFSKTVVSALFAIAGALLTNAGVRIQSLRCNGPCSGGCKWCSLWILQRSANIRSNLSVSQRSVFHVRLARRLPPHRELDAL
ncbi:hypothetical protein C8R45DRAFT_996700 [Mycena sanguinolenta]|nr:hypothetical protein C8R45DRAFT_996700 [Mycena sanguinolenta]